MVSTKYLVDGVEVEYEEFHSIRTNLVGRDKLPRLDVICRCLECGARLPVYVATCDCEFSYDYEQDFN